MIDAEKLLLDNGYEDVKFLTNYSYDTAIIGVTNTDQVVYSFELMVEYLVKNKNFLYEEAVEWIEYNTIRALSCMGNGAPLVMYDLIKESNDE